MKVIGGATTAAMALCLMAAGHVYAADHAVTGGGVVVQGVTPTACSVGVSKPLGSTAGKTAGGDAGGHTRISLGKLEERCNSASGFDTFATTFPAQPRAQFIVDSSDVPTASGGVTRIDGSNTAGELVRTIAYETDEAPPQTMTFTIRAR